MVAAARAERPDPPSSGARPLPEAEPLAATPHPARAAGALRGPTGVAIASVLGLGLVALLALALLDTVLSRGSGAALARTRVDRPPD